MISLLAEAKQFSVPMALVDYIPVALFLVAIIILQHDLYNKLSKGAFSLFAAGTIMIFSAGFLKATYKLLYAANVCDFACLSQMFFPVQSLGFILAGIAIICMLFVNQGEGKTYSLALPVILLLATEVAPEEFKGTMIFVVVMILGVLGMNGGLAYVSFKRKYVGCGILFVLAFILMLCMGYLSSKNFDKEIFNWMAEIVNVLGQGCFLAGAVWLRKKGFGKEINA